MKSTVIARHFIIFFFFIISSLLLQSQNVIKEKGEIKGLVVDADSKERIELATIKLLNPKDSTLVSARSASHSGGFTFSVALGEFILEASLLGYNKAYRDIKLSTNKPKIDLDTILLYPNDIFLSQVEITGELPAMQVKGDTIEFNASAYSIDGSSKLSDLLKQIPGLELDQNGILKANGKIISRILLNGKEYFGNDIAKALTTLPADMINKLQLFEKESEEAKASGIKDPDPEQVLNLDIKDEYKRSIFGDTKSGFGNKERHVNRFNTTKMHGDNQYSLIGNINNINDFGGSGYGGYSMGASFDDNISKELGGNFNIQQSEKLSINGSATYQNDKSKNEFASNYYSSMIDQYSERNSTGINRRQNMNMNATLDWRPDSLTTIYIRTNFSYNDGENIINSMDSAIIANTNRTSTSTNNFSENNGFRVNNSVMFSRRLNKNGRNITFNIGQGYNKSNNDGTNYSEKKYWERNSTEILDQTSKGKNESVSYNFSARYVEPIGKKNRLTLSYSISSSEGYNLGDVRKKDPLTGEYSLIDQEYFRYSDSYRLMQNIGLGFQRSEEKYNFNINLSANPSSSRNKSIKINFPNEDIKQSVVNYSPSARFMWMPDRNTHIGFNYNGSTNHPSISQLSSVPIIHNAMSQTVGNPNLRPSFNNNFNLDFRKSDFESGRYISTSLNYSYIFNSVTSYRTIDEHSNNINSYRNVDGNSNTSLYITYNTPLKNKKINLGGSFNTSYSRNVSFLNDKKQNIDRISLSPTFYGRFYSEKLETSLNLGIAHFIAENNTSDKKRSNNTDYRLSHDLKIKLPLDFSINSNLHFSYRAGLGKDIKKDETMWNLSASKLFLKDKRGTLQIEFYDVLNDFREQTSTINGSDYNSYWRRVVNNYFIFSFSYRFNVPLGKG